MQKGKVVKEALQIAMKRREVKGKGDKERYGHLNAEFQRIARRDKKAFLSDQCKEIASPGSMNDTGCLGLVHWDDPEGGYGEGGGFRMGNTGIPVADSFRYLEKAIQYCKVKKIIN